MDNGFSKENLKKYAAQSRAEFEKVLGDLVRIPSVSGQQEHKADVRRAAEYAVGLLESFGARAKLYETGGHPMVYGRFDRSPDLPTVTVYNHLDVQPAGPVAQHHPGRCSRGVPGDVGERLIDDAVAGQLDAGGEAPWAALNGEIRRHTGGPGGIDQRL